MKFIYLHGTDYQNYTGPVYLVNAAYIAAIVRGTEDDYTTVFIDSQVEELKELFVKELPEGIRKMIEANES